MSLDDLFVDPSDLPQGAYGFIQLLFLLLAYGYILFVASNLISDGSELLLLVPSVAGIVGSCVLPVLGAVPDGAIVLFSGLGNDAQEQLSVGVGALAGSTIMLVTVPWCLSIIGGRVNIDPRTRLPVYKRPAGAADWSKLSPPGNMALFGTGVLLGPNVKTGGFIILGTAVSYFLIQGPAFFYSSQSDSVIAEAESEWALSGLIICCIFFVSYLAYQYYISIVGDEVKENKTEEITKKRILSGDISLSGALYGLLDEVTGSAEDTPLTGSTQGHLLTKRLEGVLRPFFEKYDADKSGAIDLAELGSVFRDLNENLSNKELQEIFRKFDQDNNGTIDYKEFVLGVAEYLMTSAKKTGEKKEHFAARDEEEGEEYDEVPEEFLDLSPEEQQYRIKMRSAWMMALGTLLVLLFSDPLVSVLSELGTRINVSSFYISFVLSPLASNASELIASYNYATKKTTKTISISLATLQGAACLNNTFCLGIFLVLIYAKSLAWEFGAETISILFVEVCIALYSFKTVHTTFDAFCIITLYPISLLIVGGLEAAGFD